MSKRVLAFMAHPDDVEFKCAGTLARLKREAGCRIAIATATSGDCGSAQLRIDEIARIRHAEAVAAAKVLDAEYYCGACADLHVIYNERNLQRFVEILRKAGPDIVITQPPVDYMVDHEMCGTLVRSACFGAPIPNYWTGDIDPAPPIGAVPHLYYCAPVDNKDLYGNPVEPGLVVDITDAQETKQQMLACHASQREWLRKHHGIDEYIEMMKRSDAAQGRRIGRPAGEGFRQHLGHGYPQDNIIAKLLNIK
ncbi:MAG TPA: PIG-L family deacetylase [Phycisphaerae bacterium]|nr:PIG-L family deacetylase [Phycisphaerae bacterium]